MQTPVLTITPRISEKAYALSLDGVYVFDVPVQANKAEVARAVQTTYSVTVTDVNILNSKGKKARSIRIGNGNRTRPLHGRRPDAKKAYVTVKKGDVIQIEAFQEVQEN